MKDKYLIVPIFLLGIAAGLFFGKNVFEEKDNHLKKLGYIFNLLKNNYADNVNVDSLFENAVNGVTDKLDPYTSYIPAELQEHSQDIRKGNFTGIGIEFQLIKDTVTIITPIKGTPAESAGLKNGDKIIKVNGSPIIGEKENSIISLLRGEKGSEVKLEIFRPSLKKTIEYKLRRDEIPVNTVDYAGMINDTTGYITLTSFGQNSFTEVSKAIKELRVKGMKNLIIDLRNNPGGLLSQAIDIADLFIKGKSLLLYTRAKNPDLEEQIYSEKSHPDTENIPLAMLVNEGSASASEILSGIIQDYDRGIIIGETTYGKGLVQTEYEFEDGSAFRLTISKYYIPSGRAISRINGSNKQDSLKSYKTRNGRIVFGGGGVVPDIRLKDTLEIDKLYDIYKNNLAYVFVRNKIENGDTENKLTIEQILNSKYFGKNLHMEFIQYAANQKIKVASGFDNYLAELLVGIYIREKFGREGMYKFMFKTDKYIQTAINNMPAGRVL